MLSASLLFLPSFHTFPPWTLEHYSTIHRVPISLSFLLNAPPAFSHQLRPWFPLRFLLPFYPSQWRGAHAHLPSAPQPGSWELMSCLLSCCQATIPPPHVQFPSALRLTSHPCVIPVTVSHVSTCWSVSAFTKDFGAGSWPFSPPGSASYQPGWLQCPGGGPSWPTRSSEF